MPKFYKQNKKRIDPRYFLNETANISEVSIPGLSDKMDLICKNQEAFFIALDLLPSETVASKIVDQAGLPDVLIPIFEQLVSMYKRNKNIKQSTKQAVKIGCMLN